MTTGIYKITNKKTGQIYIGQSINIERRFQEHIRGNDCPNSYIDNAIRKYGKDHFCFEIIEEFDKNTPSLDNILNNREKYYITYYNTFQNDFHYNLTIGGDGLGFGENHPNYGKHHSKKTKKKISEAISGKNHPMYGKHHSEEAKKKISEANKGKYNGKNHPMYGKHRSKETKKKISENCDNSGKNNPMYGKHHSEETKKKISDTKIKKYARIIKAGKNKNNKQVYAIKYKGKRIKTSISINTLYKWFFENYPLEIIKVYEGDS